MLQIVLEAAVRSGLAGLAIWLALRAARVSSPRVEMMVWSLLLIGALAMPVTMHLIRLPISIPAPQTATSWTSMTLAGPSPLDYAATDDVDTRSFIKTAVKAASLPIDWWRMADRVYEAVAFGQLLRLLVGFGRAQYLRVTARPYDRMDPRFRSVRTSQRVTMPMTVGRTILLPANCRSWSPVQLAAVLAHEGNHIRNRDFFTLLLANVHRAIFWFNPLAWWLKHRLAELAETISDEAAIRAIGDRTTYAEILLTVASRASKPGLGVAMARTSNVSRRIDFILRETPMEPNFTLRRKAAVAVFVLPLLGLAAGANAQSPAPETPTQAAATGPQPSPSPATLAAQFKPKTDSTELDPTLKDHPEAFVGTFQFDPELYPNQVISLTYWMGQLYGQLTGEPMTTVLLRPDGDFVYHNRHLAPRNAEIVDGKVVAFDISWRRGSTRLVRVDNNEAKRMNALYTQRVQDQLTPKAIVPLAEQTLEQFVGYYKLPPDQVFTFTREGTHFFSKKLDTQRVEIFPYTDRDFFYTTSPTQVTFEAERDGHFNMAVLHWDGWANHAARITEDEARQLEDAYKARLADQRRPRTVAAVDPKAMDAFVASYQLRPQVNLDFSREDTRYYIKVNGTGKTEVYPFSDHAFFYTTAAAQISFERDASGRVTKLVLHENGWETTAERISVGE